MSRMTSNAVASSSSLKDLSEHRERKSHNKLGANQYKDRPLLHDPHVADLLNDYHSKGFTDNRVISKLLLEEHNVILGERSIYRRKKMLGLWASKRTTQDLSDAVKRQLVMTQMAKDTTGKMGAQAIKKNIFTDTGLHLTRDYIRAEMKRLDPVGHAARNPAHNKKKRQQEEAEAAAAAAAAAGAAAVADQSTLGSAPPIETSTEARSLIGGSGQGQSSVSQGPPRTRPSARAQQSRRPATQPHQRLHNPPSAQPRTQPSTPRSAGRTARPPPAPSTSMRPPQPLLPPAYTMPPMAPVVHNEVPSALPSHAIVYPTSGYSAPHDLLSSPPAPLRLSPHTSSPLMASTSSYHQPHSLVQDDQHDQDADYSEDEFDNGDMPPQHTEGASTSPRGQAIPTIVGSNSAIARSATMERVVHRLQDTTTSMQDLTRVINSLSLEDDRLDSQSYITVLQAMEAAALLERQLSRVVSQARGSGTSSTSGS